MGYVLLWIEILAVSLLFVAWLTAWVTRWQRRWLRNLVWIVSVVGLLLLHLAPVVGLGMAVYFGHPNLPGLFPCSMLLVAFLIGTILLRYQGFRKEEEASGRLTAAFWPRGKIFLAGLVACLLFGMTFWNLDLEANAKLAALKTEASMNLQSLEPPRISKNDNAALIYERAIKMVAPNFELPKQWDVIADNLEGTLPPLNAQDPELIAYFKKMERVRTLLLEAVKKPDCQFFRDPLSWPFFNEKLSEQIGGMRYFARYFTLHAVWKATQGDTHSAFEDLQATFVLARHQAQEPFLITKLVGIAIENMAASCFQQILKISNPTEADLALIQFEDTESYVEDFSRALNYESLVLWGFVAQSAGETMPNLRIDLPDFLYSLPRPLQSIYRVFLMEKEIASIRTLLKEAYHLLSSPYYKVVKQYQNQHELQSRRELVIGFASQMAIDLITHLEPMHASAAKGDAVRQNVEIALALKQYQLKNRRFPEKLDDLVPDFLFTVPQDPFDGKPMKYKKTDQGVVVYSIGPDMVDNGGTPLEAHRKGDVSFELLNRKP